MLRARGEQNVGLTPFGRAVIAASEANLAGLNLMKTLQDYEGSGFSSSDAVELAYHFQSGSYVEHYRRSKDEREPFVAEIASHLLPLLDDGSSLLDCGAGELTTLAPLIAAIGKDLDVTALELSWSRLNIGRDFWRSDFRALATPSLVVGEIGNLPFDDQSFDVVLTVHALEPNRGREDELLAELLRVASRHVLLIEPNYDRESEAVQERMNFHSYVRGIEKSLSQLSERSTISVTRLQNSVNTLNPSWAFLISKGSERNFPDSSQKRLRCPNTGYRLAETNAWMVARETPLRYPIASGIPLLRAENALLL